METNADTDLAEQPDFAVGDFGFDLDPELFQIENGAGFEVGCRYVKPYLKPEIQEAYLTYRSAEHLADELEFTRGARAYVIVDGSFYFGDFLEALIVRNNWLVRTMTVSTLSMNENNVDSLANLLDGGFVEHLDLIVSAYFYSHERHNLVEYPYERLDRDDRFQLAVAGSHCKLCLPDLAEPDGWKMVLHGSANLRSSPNIEQLMIEENPALYEFNREVQERILSHYATIDHEIRGKELWQVVAKTSRASTSPAPLAAERRRLPGSAPCDVSRAREPEDGLRLVSGSSKRLKHG